MSFDDQLKAWEAKEAGWLKTNRLRLFIDAGLFVLGLILGHLL